MIWQMFKRLIDIYIIHSLAYHLFYGLPDTEAIPGSFSGGSYDLMWLKIYC